MVQRWAGSHDLPRSDRTLGPQVPVLTTVTSTLGMGMRTGALALGERYRAIGTSVSREQNGRGSGELE